jgi:hypothetical protein
VKRQGRSVILRRALHQGQVQPLVELEANSAQDADVFEAECAKVSGARFQVRWR